MWHDRRVRIPSPALVVLVGPSGAGKSTWATATFAAGEIVSSDRLRAVVGEAEDDLAASADAFALLDAIVDARLRRGLTVVIDTLGLDAERRRAWVAAAARHGVPAIALAFDTPAETCRAWNRDRPRPVPAAAVADQVRKFRVAREEIAGEGFAEVHGVVPAPSAGGATVPLVAAVGARPRLRFGLSVSRFDWTGGKRTLADNWQGKRFNSPNDVIVKSNGDIYFTDPIYGLPERETDKTRETDFCGVYRWSAKTGEVTLLTRELSRPNGLAFSPDESLLYVANSDPAKAIWMVYPVKADGTLDSGKEGEAP